MISSDHGLIFENPICIPPIFIKDYIDDFGNCVRIHLDKIKPSSKSKYIGIPIISCEITSGGVMSMPNVKHITSAMDLLFAKRSYEIRFSDVRTIMIIGVSNAIPKENKLVIIKFK